MSDKKDQVDAPRVTSPQPEALHHVEHALSQLRFGAIHLTVHDGKVVQLDVTERKRFPA